LDFEWDAAKERQNITKHGVPFREAIKAFDDPKRVILEDVKHSQSEARYYCFGKAGKNVMTVRYTLRYGKIRIIGAAYWRDGRRLYEEKNRV